MSLTIDYKQKYLKYKNKYLKLKNQQMTGGDWRVFLNNYNKSKSQDKQSKVEHPESTSQDEQPNVKKIKKILKTINEKKKYFNIIDKLLCKDNFLDIFKSKKNNKNILILKRILKTIYIELNTINNNILIDSQRCSSKILLELFSTKLSNALRELTKWKNKMEYKLNEINNVIEFKNDEIIKLTFNELKEETNKIIKYKKN